MAKVKSLQSFTRRRAALAVALAGIIAVMTACSSSSSSPTASSANLQFWTITPSTGTAGINAVIAAFQKSHPGVTVTYSTRPDSSYKNSLQNAIGSADGPDVYEIPYGTQYNIAYAKDGYSVPLTSYYSKYGWASNYPASTLTRMTVNGTKYNLPWSGFPFVIYYRKDLFAKAGITSPPTTFAQFESDLATLKAHGIIPIALGGEFGTALGWFSNNITMQSCGWTEYTALMNLKTKWAGVPCVTNAYATWKKWVDSGYFPPSFLSLNPNNGQSDALLYTGKAAMAFGGVWYSAAIETQKLPQSQYGLFAFPVSDAAVQYGGSQLAISTKSTHQALAAEFMNYITSPAVQEQFYGKLNQTFSLVNGVNPPAGSPSLSTSDQSGILSSAKYLYAPSDGVLPAAVSNENFQVLEQVALGQLSPSQVGAAIDKAAG